MAYTPLIGITLDPGEYATNNKLAYQTLLGVTMSFAALICMCAADAQVQTSSSVHKGIIYRNPRVYNVEYTFEMFPDPNKIDRSKDLKLWVPIPREWDSQKAVKIISVKPEPHAKYVDPEYGNPMLFWDFGKELEKPSYKVRIRCRLEQYETYSHIDPNRIGPYNKTSKDYILYTQSTRTISITDKVKELAETAVGNEKNPYFQARRVYEFVRKKMYYGGGSDLGGKRGHNVKDILEFPVIEKKPGQEYYIGDCYDLSTLFVALCRVVGIPARNVLSRWDRQDVGPTTIRIEPEVKPTSESIDLSANGLAISLRPRGFRGHGWAEIYLPNYGWITVDPTYEEFGHSHSNKVVVISKGRDIKIGPHAPQKDNENYGDPGSLLHEGRSDWLIGGVWNTANMQRIEIERLHRPDPFPADALAEYVAKLYPETEAEKNLALYRKRTLRWIDQNTREHTDKIEALAQAYKKKPKARYEHEAFICHMLRKVVGEKKFDEVFETYTNLRVKSGEPASMAHFQKIAEDIYGQPLDWFFKQWIGYTELPQLQLDAVTFSEDEKGWHVRGNLRQLNKSLFRLPVELVLKTEKTTDHKTLWLENKDTEFGFNTTSKPKGILVDPNNDILQIREMPPLLESSSYDEIAFCTITDQFKADLYGWTPLHFAVEAGQIDVVEYLIAARVADVGVENRQGLTPLDIAARRNHKEVVKLLIDNGADVSLHVATHLGDLARAKSLIEEGAGVNAEDFGGETPLHIAAAKGHKEIAELLIAKGADVNAKNNWGETPLHTSAAKGHKEIVEYLVGKGADVNIRENEGKTPLKLAKEKGHTEIVEILRKHGAKE
jgi:transglutaminase-like putative cysteine protease